MTAFEPIGSRWEPLVWISRAALDDASAISPRCCRSNIKRMLAYSSIAHAGYVLVALTARSRDRHGRRDVLPGGVRLHEHRRVRRGERTSPARASAS